MEYKDIKKVIESCHLNFLIGSGASKPFLDTLTDIEKALDDLHKRNGLNNEQSDSTVLKLIEVSIKHYYFKKCIEKNVELLSISDTSNETLNTYIELLQSIQTILAKRFTNIISKQVNLFTTNMDVFLDVALEKLGYSINDGFSGRMNPKFGTENFHNIINKVSSHYEYQSTVPLFNLFKLHGSLNWAFKKAEEEIYFDGSLSVTKKLSEIEFNEDDLITCFNIEGKALKLSEIYKSAAAKNIDVELNKKMDLFISSYQELIMVNPNKDKFEETTLKYSYYELLRMYSNNLERENSVLIVSGFSFADEHICKITTRVAKSNPTLLILIFAYNDEAEEEIEHRLGKASNIIYLPRTDGNFFLSKVNQLFIGKLANELISPTKNKEEKEAIKEEGNG
ncbi:MAG: hypothetical protein WDZ45_12215 [Flavobacteriaceae bacterium]